MSKYYDTEGNEINQDRFIKFYSKCYYLDNSSFVEKGIEKLMSSDKISPDDVMLILRWKMGRIDQKKSQDSQQICLRNMDNRFTTYSGRGKEINAEKLCFYVSNNLTGLRGERNAQIILNSLMMNSSKNIGTVYLITLLYFITNGEFPIYDRYASIAVNAILNNTRLGSVIKSKELPSKNENGFKQLLLEEKKVSLYLEYINKLTVLFGDRYKTNRDIDRALWVYGHCFRDKE